MSIEQAGLVVACALTAAAGAAAAYPFAAAAAAARDDRMLSPEDRERRVRIRRLSALYRWFEPIAEEISLGAAEGLPLLLAKLQRDLDLTAPAAGWRAADWFAVRRLESPLVFATGAVLGYVLADGWWYGVLVGLGVSVVYPYAQGWLLAGRAAAYRDRVQARLPLVADLIALMLEGGRNLGQAMDQAAAENRGQPLGEELARARSAVRAGEAEPAALQAMADRVADADLSELVFMVNTSDSRGTEVKDDLRDMAERLRVRRVQRLEKKAGEAQVKISGPALIIMLACLAVVMAPFLLSGAAAGR